MIRTKNKIKEKKRRSDCAFASYKSSSSSGNGAFLASLNINS
jgi:hypothetical protein